MPELSREVQADILQGIIADADTLMNRGRVEYNNLSFADRNLERREVEFMLYIIKQLEMKIKFLGGYHY